ncbi:hypothetical protein [Agrococcus sp. DT81.2]|uniref:hypothetical protein n=1 Tax=Agrococcus sp. DT81.2 TaxID=3393414 RepID=UPI003CE5819B
MNTDTKWEAALFSDLKPADTVRLTREDGDTIHAQVSMNGYGVAASFGYVPFTAFSDTGYIVERAVPERTLPTEPGVYASQTEIDRASGNLVNCDIYATSPTGWHDLWVNGDVPDSDVPADLVRLVPVTEVEEAEKRGRDAGIREVHERYRSLGHTCTAVEISSAYPDVFEAVRNV